MTKEQTRLLESLQCAVCEQQLASVCCVHVMRLDVFQCDLCHAVYAGKYRLLQHLQAVHAYRPQNSLIVKFGKTYKRTTTDNKTISQTCDQKTTKLEYDEVHMKSQLGQHKDLQKHLLDQHCTTSSNGLKCERTFRKPVLPSVHNNLLQRNSRKAVTVRGTVASRSDQSGDKRTKTKQKPFQCDVCKKGYSLKAGLNLHICSHSSVKLKNDLISYESHTIKKCCHCDAKFAQNGDLIQHMSVQAGETSYSCKMCDARFAKMNCLTQHMSVHTGPKPYKCKICDTRFAQSTGLIRHMRLHTGEKPYQCKICNIRFAQSSHLTQHMRVHTGEKPYQCKICDAKFAHSTVLTQHIRLHTGEKPYQCKICDTRFAQSSHLTRHMGIHAAVKLYQCKICDASFARSGHLTKHARVHTNVNR